MCESDDVKLRDDGIVGVEFDSDGVKSCPIDGSVLRFGDGLYEEGTRREIEGSFPNRQLRPIDKACRIGKARFVPLISR
jgi:hypothetical protein